MDTISLTGMSFYGYHGALSEERRIGQKFLIDVTLSLDLSRAGETDELADTVNYAEVFEIVRRLAEGEPFRLIEKLAGEINSSLLAAFPQISSVTTTVHKPSAPIAGIFADVSVKLHLDRT